MARFTLTQTRYEGEKLVEVELENLDEPFGPNRYESEVVPVSEVVHRLKQGDVMHVTWILPLVCRPLVILSVKVVILPDGQESIDLNRWGWPADAFRMTNLPRMKGPAEDPPGATIHYL